MNTVQVNAASINTDFNRLQAIHNQRNNYANWTHKPTAIEECERCGLRNYHSYLYKCYGCEVLYCMTCIPEDPVYVIDYGDFIPIFCDVVCKNIYMKAKHPELTDCDECHMMWPENEYKKKCSDCRNGVCEKCTSAISDGKFQHTHLDWEDPT